MPSASFEERGRWILQWRSHQSPMTESAVYQTPFLADFVTCGRISKLSISASTSATISNKTKTTKSSCSSPFSSTLFSLSANHALFGSSVSHAITLNLIRFRNTRLTRGSVPPLDQISRSFISLSSPPVSETCLSRSSLALNLSPSANNSFLPLLFI